MCTNTKKLCVTWPINLLQYNTVKSDEKQNTVLDRLYRRDVRPMEVPMLRSISVKRSDKCCFLSSLKVKNYGVC